MAARYTTRGHLWRHVHKITRTFKCRKILPDFASRNIFESLTSLNSRELRACSEKLARKKCQGNTVVMSMRKYPRKYFLPMA
jgi:hypothetical protein